MDEAADIIYQAVDADANIVFGAAIDESQEGGEVSVTVIATGFPDFDTSEPFQPDIVSNRRDKDKSNQTSREMKRVNSPSFLSWLFSFRYPQGPSRALTERSVESRPRIKKRLLRK